MAPLPSTRTVLITGAARGIGRACATAFAEQGYRVALVDLSHSDVREAASELQSITEAADFVCDVTVKAEVDALIERVVNRFGTVDCLVANAGVYPRRPASFVEHDEADFDVTMHVNVKGVYLCGQAVARQMIKQNDIDRDRRGSIINLTSLAALQGMPIAASYYASKGAVMSMTRSMAVALAPHGIRVNAVGPGVTATPMVSTFLQANQPKPLTADVVRSRFLSRVPMSRFAEPKEIASVVAFFASDASSYVTGQTLFIDGGVSALNFLMPEELSDHTELPATLFTL